MGWDVGAWEGKKTRSVCAPFHSHHDEAECFMTIEPISADVSGLKGLAEQRRRRLARTELKCGITIVPMLVPV